MQRLISQFVPCRQKDVLSLKLLYGSLLNVTLRKQNKIAEMLFIPFRTPGSGVGKLEIGFPALSLLFHSVSLSPSFLP